MQIIPAVDVLDGSVVRLLHGKFDQATAYGVDPVASVTKWTVEGASLVHVVDLNGARTGDQDVGLLSALGESGVAFQVGGGIRDRITAERAVENGAKRVVVGTIAVHGGHVLDEVVAAVGGERVVAAIDVRDGRARGTGWTDAGMPLRDVVRGIVESGVAVALVTGIERDGAMTGPNLQILAQVREIAPTLGLIASGGIGSLDDVSSLALSDCDGAIVGRALYEERFSLAEAEAAASDARIERMSQL